MTYLFEGRKVLEPKLVNVLRLHPKDLACKVVKEIRKTSWDVCFLHVLACHLKFKLLITTLAIIRGRNGRDPETRRFKNKQPQILFQYVAYC